MGAKVKPHPSQPSPEISYPNDSSNELFLRPTMFLVDENYEPINEIDSDVPDTDDKDASVDPDDVTQPDDTDELTSGSTMPSSVIPCESTSSSSSPSSEITDPYDSEEETEPLNFTDRKSGSSTTTSDESDFETDDITRDLDDDSDNTTVGTTTDSYNVPEFTVGGSLEDEEQECKEIWEREHADELGLNGVKGMGGDGSVRMKREDRGVEMGVVHFAREEEADEKCNQAIGMERDGVLEVNIGKVMRRGVVGVKKASIVRMKDGEWSSAVQANPEAVMERKEDNRKREGLSAAKVDLMKENSKPNTEENTKTPFKKVLVSRGIGDVLTVCDDDLFSYGVRNFYEPAFVDSVREFQKLGPQLRVF